MDVHLISDSELPEWTRALDTGFLRTPTATEEQLAARRTMIGTSRAYGAFDAGRCVATYHSFPQELTAVGGAQVPADAISNVTVSPTHRRRGLLTRMVSDDLKAAKDRGDVVATLVAAEYRIYGRYGFGPATTMTEWSIDVPRAGFDPRHTVPLAGGRIELIDRDEVRKLGPGLHERLRRAQPGAVSRPDHWWHVYTGVLRPLLEWTEPFYAVYYSAAGEVDGLVSYTADDTWSDAKQPLDTASVRWLLSATPAAERALWHYLCSIDWITRVKSGARSPDDLLPLLLPDPRAASIVTQADWLWVRILDVVRALEARTYQVPGTLVLEIVDGAGLTGGRYLLDASAEGASCEPTTRDADLTLDVAELASLWLGDMSAVRLAALGRLREHRAGAVRRADAMLRTPTRPWCPDLF
ncbi:GNAT family N-acetyltransferase [Streptomyces niveiscabiei]|uniref:GNAT family N-acetyltransferase n=1 Tax=Streptomyces niveiscabiei TaxID=164115 RepID=UPI0029ACA7D2|nr:GNAT family N-acetyltransferase [Streptomyces niveiscabiei]MDX3387821.1 GNAT family N-acetyltransferase [Streptomyces niveiscabiei]